MESMNNCKIKAALPPFPLLSNDLRIDSHGSVPLMLLCVSNAIQVTAQSANSTFLFLFEYSAILVYELLVQYKTESFSMIHNLPKGLDSIKILIVRLNFIISSVTHFQTNDLANKC